MKKFLTRVLIAVPIAVCAFGAEGYKILNKIHIGGEGRWDYVAIDPANRRLYVSHNTVRTHLRHLYAKLGTHRRAEAVARARDLGLLAPSPRRDQATSSR